MVAMIRSLFAAAPALAYDLTVVDLAGLDAAELADLGLDRADVVEVARRVIV